MKERLFRLPLIVLLVGMAGLAMLIPAVHASTISDHDVARAFFYPALFFLVLFALVAIATANYRIRRQGRSYLISMLAFFTILPALLAVPFVEAVPDTSFLNAYVEMVSSLTTTGLTLFSPERLAPSVHLWRAEVGWLGGFFVWVTAVAIFAPLNLGGFEVSSANEIGQGASLGTGQFDQRADPAERLRRFGARLAPIYGGLTLVLWVGLVLAGDTPLVAICHAMSVMATSGISPAGGLGGGGAGYAGEVLILLFFIFAFSRVTFSPEARADGWAPVRTDPELRLGLLFVTAIPILLFVRHAVAAYDEATVVRLADGIAGLWGSLFTVTSFLTTTGFESEAWGAARTWSGLTSPGLLLMGLALFGGGVATTAGGVKLLRIYALYKHGMREMEKLVQPSSIGGAGSAARRFRRQGAFVAWIFFMLFALSIAAVMCLFSIFGLRFDDALIMTMATLTTTGPLTVVAGEAPLPLAQYSASVKGVAVGAMVLGRLETLAIIALLNPEFWR